jgi:3-oxoacyl-[acyl-carrier-protein] synthase-3
MAKLKFHDIKISAIATTVGDKKIVIDDEMQKFGYDKRSLKRVKKSIGLESRYIASEGVTTTDLCVHSAKRLFDDRVGLKDDIEALIFVTQSPDYIAPSSAIVMQDRLKLPKSIVAYDVNLGCSGFVVGLTQAYSLINSGLKKVLLLVGDVNRYFAGEKDKNFTPLMGDAGSAIIIQKGGNKQSFFSLYSDGSGYEHLVVLAGGLRNPKSPQTQKTTLRDDGSYRSDEDLYMNGKEIFNFAIKTVPPLIDEVLEDADMSIDDIDYFVLHQANRYILQNIAKKLGKNEHKVPLQTGTIYGNQNSASIPGTINGFLSQEFTSGNLKVVFAGFGIGLSWAGAYIECDEVYSPKVMIYDNGK